MLKYPRYPIISKCTSNSVELTPFPYSYLIKRWRPSPPDGLAEMLPISLVANFEVYFARHYFSARAHFYKPDLFIPYDSHYNLNSTEI